MNKWIPMTMACVLVACPAWAGPPVTTEIPDSAVWAVHVDVAAVTGSEIGKGVLALITAEGSPVPAEGVAKALAGWDKLSDVQSVTLYGSSASEADAVLVAKLKYDRAELVKLAKITDDTPTTTHGEGEHAHVIYALTVPHKKAPEGVKRHGCFYTDQIIVLAGDLAKVREALDLLDGKGKPLSSDNLLRGMLQPSKGSFMLAAVSDMAPMLKAIRARTAPADAPAGRRTGPSAALLAKAQTARAEVGEVEGNVFATLELGMASEEDAQNVNMMAQGMRAMMLLGRDPQKDDGIKKDVLALVEAIKSGVEGKTVAVQFRYATRDLLGLMAKLMDLHVAKKAAEAAEAAKKTAP